MKILKFNYLQSQDFRSLDAFMLTHLTLINFALADHLSLDIEQGFNVLTGETGAGKSLLLDALSACLGERVDSHYVRFGTEKADVTAIFSYEAQSAEAQWLKEHELEDESGEIHLRRVIFATGRSKAWINGRPSSLADVKSLGRLLVQLYSQHSQQQLLDSPYPRQWLDQCSGLQNHAHEVRHAYQHWQTQWQHYQTAQQAQHNLQQRIENLTLQLSELEPILEWNYQEIEQEFDCLSHHEQLMQDAAYGLNILDENEQNIGQELGHLIRRLEPHCQRGEYMAAIYSALLNAQSELEDASSTLRQFIDRQSFDPERLHHLNEQLETFHHLARKYRLPAEDLKNQYETWHDELQQLENLEKPEILAEQVEIARQQFEQQAQHLDQLRQNAALKLAEKLTQQVKPLALPEAHFQFQFEPLTQPNADGISHIQLLFSANKGIPAQPLAKVASGGELSRIALVMQVMNAEKSASEVLVFDEIDVGISGATAEIVGRLLASLAQHVQILCITHQAQVAAQSDQHLLVQKQQTDPATSQIQYLNESQRILEIARMTGGVEINHATLQHAQQLRQLKFQSIT